MDLLKNLENIMGILMKKKVLAICCTVAFAIVVALNVSGCTSETEVEEIAESLPQQEQENAIPISEETNTIDVSDASVNVPKDSDTDNMVAISVENAGRANPFLPPGDPIIIPGASAPKLPQGKLEYDVLPPLETPNADTNAKRVATTQVSGIMYDKTSPSAILKFDGSDYLVRSGDVINGYKVLAIDKSVVTVQVGSNVYKAGVGQLLEEGKNGVTYNQVANLSNKFGGSKK